MRCDLDNVGVERIEKLESKNDVQGMQNFTANMDKAGGRFAIFQEHRKLFIAGAPGDTL